jgi:UDP-N-acetyl-D-glucosamine dehydrogenase
VPEVPETRKYAHLAGRTSEALDAGLLGSVDAVVIVTDHDDVDYELVAREAVLVVDTRNAMARVEDPAAEVVQA